MSDAAAERKRIAEMLEREARVHEAARDRFNEDPELGDLTSRGWMAFAQQKVSEALRRFAQTLND